MVFGNRISEVSELGLELVSSDSGNLIDAVFLTDYLYPLMDFLGQGPVLMTASAAGLVIG